MTAISLRQRLLEAEQDFLLVRSDASLKAFGRKWDTLCSDFQDALDSGLVDSSLDEIARSVFLRVAILGENLAEAEEQASTLQSSAMTDLEELLAQMTLDDLVEQQSSSTHRMVKSNHPSVRKKSQSPSTSLPPLVQPAYDWIVDNLHNPYPSTSLKSTLASAAAMTYRSMDDWFKSIRRHIGWASLVKRHFKGSRSLAVAAAHRIFCADGDGHSTVSHEVADELFAMKVKLVSLYPDHTTRKLPALPSTPSTSRTRSPSPFSTTWRGAKDHFQRGRTELCESAQSSPLRPPSLVYTSSDSEDDDGLLVIIPAISCKADLKGCGGELDTTRTTPAKDAVDAAAISGPNFYQRLVQLAAVQDDRTLPLIANSAPRSVLLPSDEESCPITVPVASTFATVEVSKKRRRSDLDNVSGEGAPRAIPAGKKRRKITSSPPAYRTTHRNLPVFECGGLLNGDELGPSHSLQTNKHSASLLHHVGSTMEGSATMTVGATCSGHWDVSGETYYSSSSPTAGLPPQSIDIGPSELSPEGLEELLDNILASIPSPPVSVDKAWGTGPVAPYALSECGPMPACSPLHLSAEQREDFEYLVFADTGWCSSGYNEGLLDVFSPMPSDLVRSTSIASQSTNPQSFQVATLGR